MRYKDKEKEERRLILKENLVGQTVMANYGKTVYHKIVDIKFDDMSTIHFDTPEKSFTIP
jgi:hypothetical protein